MAIKWKGGDKVVSTLNRIGNMFRKKRVLRVGFLEGSTFPDGTSVPMVAAINNFGAPKARIPARPFFSNMVKNKSPGWGAAMGNVLKLSNYNVDETMTKMGLGIEGQLKESIISTNAPSLSPVTVMLRGMRSNDQSLVVTRKTVGVAAQRVKDGKTNYGASTKPLVDTKHMLNSTGFEIKT